MFREGLDVVGCGLAIRERVSLGKVRTGWKGFERHCVRFVKVRIFLKRWVCLTKFVIVSLRQEEVG